jgi:hypothetical protein
MSEDKTPPRHPEALAPISGLPEIGINDPQVG